MRFLLMTIYAPLASWGDIAVGEMRGSWDRPSRSAILGLCAAALGVEREAQGEHDELSDGLGVAVRLDLPGRVLYDYHTAQTVAQRDVRRAKPCTRRELLAAGAPQTILSRRALRQDSLATAALWEREGSQRSLDRIAAALARPRFVLYAGRKANAFGLPLDPAIIEAPTLAGAFALRSPLREGLAGWDALKPGGGWGREVSHDMIAAERLGMTQVRTEMRRDHSPQRMRWQFAERPVVVSLLPPGAVS